MEGMFGLLVVAVGASVGYLVFVLRGQERAKRWRLAAETAGLTNVRMPEFLGVGTSLTGTAGPLSVKIQAYHRGKYEHGTRVVIGGFRHGTYALSIRPEGVATAIEKTFGEREIELGDPVFDGAAYVQGSPGLIRAIFDAETRRVVRTLLGGVIHAEGTAGSKTFDHLRVAVSDDELRVEIRSSPFDGTEQWLPSVLTQLIGIGNRLRRPDDLPGRIADNTRSEPVEEVRLANLRTLTSEFAGHSATRNALLEALHDDSTAVRLHAASALGPEGLETLHALASAESPDAVAAQAIEALGTAFPPERAMVRLGEAREAGQDATALACVNRLAASSGAAVVAELSGTLATAGDMVAAAAARALGRIGDAAAEPALIGALGRDEGAVRVAAAEALGRMGSPQAVVPLRSAASSHLLDGDLRRAARQAVAEIQSRVSGASPGQLSLAGDEAGRLSLVEEEQRGRLSMAAARPGDTLRREDPTHG